MTLLPLAKALERLLAGVEPIASEEVQLADAAHRVLAADVLARRTQPPFPASAMDGYAVRAADLTGASTQLSVIGTSAAGHGFEGSVEAGETVRIFTGAPVPAGADAILIQENAVILADGLIEASGEIRPGHYVRPAGLDFEHGETLLGKGRILDPAALSLAAAANHPSLTVVGKPLVAILATGDELLLPGTEPGPGQIIASNSYGVAAIAKTSGAEVVDLGIAADDREILSAAVRKSLDAGADILVTLGGASVGDHDLVQEVLGDEGMELDFWRIAMRPGKPLMYGKLHGMRFLGLPGNPVSSLVCSHLFLKPLIAKLADRPCNNRLVQATLARDMAANDQREDYVRARVTIDEDGKRHAEPFPVQDSSMLKTLAQASGLIVRPPHAPEAKAGSACNVLMLL